MASICVFCGSKPGVSPEHVNAAEMLGRFLAVEGHTLIYGGGSTGIMGALADSVLKHQGRVIGVITTQLAKPELMHFGVADMRITANMHERKALMHSLADVYVALPGGFGTLEEFFEALTWAQLELHARPVAILNVDRLYDGLLQTLNLMAEQQFLSARCVELLKVMHDVDGLLEWIAAETAGVPGTLQPVSESTAE